MGKESINRIDVLKTHLKETVKKIEALEECYATGEIEKDLYQKFISKYIKEKLDINTELGSMTFENSNLEKRLEKYCQILRNLPLLWDSNSYKGKLELQELMFPQGILFDRENTNFRTPEINEVAFTINEISKGLEEKNKGDLDNFDLKSPSVPGRRLELPRLTTYAPQTYLSTNSNIRAKKRTIKKGRKNKDF